LDGAAERREGKRILVLGATRKGKTTFTRSLIAEMLDAGACKVALMHDQKLPDQAQYEGPQASSVDQARDLVMEGHRKVVCRAGVSVEDAAAVVRDMVEAGLPSALLVDETMPALKVNEDTGEPMPRVWAGPTPIWILLQGGGLGASLVQLVQVPQTLPTSLVDSAEAYVFFNLGGRSLQYCADLQLLPREAMSVIPRLAPGECCVFFADREWDRTIYGPA
jgi:hypothetical protein